MKFGQKIFLMSFILIIIAINGIGIIMINHTYKENIEAEIDKNMLQINSIMTEIDAGINTLSYVANTYRENNVNIKVYSQGKMVYTNFKEEFPDIEDKLITDEDKKAIEEVTEEIIDIENSDLNVEENNDVRVYIEENKLFMKMTKEGKILITLSDISKVNDLKKEQIDDFIMLSLGSSFAIALILSLSVHLLTRKIKLLNKTVKEVEGGNYEAKVPKLGNDEIGNVGKSFNNMTQAVQKNIAQIQEISENRKRFIGDLTHEIRTPLTTIIGYSSLIKSKSVTDKKNIYEYNNKIHEEGIYIEKISQKLMDLLLVENGSIEIEEINLSEEMYNIANELQELFKNVKYKITITDDVYVKTDKVLLKSLVLNLVKNAINAYEENPIVEIKVNEKREIKIVDYGKGIPKAELEKVKEPFYTLSKDRNRTLYGMGLGLTLCIEIVQALKGTLQIESKENEGTMVTIVLGVNDEN